MSNPETLYDKIWRRHEVAKSDDGSALIYIDRHLVHEVTSPQAFEKLELDGRKVRRPDAALAVPDHNVPTTDRSHKIADPLSKKQIDLLRDNVKRWNIELYDMLDSRQGIVHVIGPEQGFTQPGLTLVCGDSIPLPMGRSVPWHLALERRRWNMCWSPRR